MSLSNCKGGNGNSEYRWLSVSVVLKDSNKWFGSWGGCGDNEFYFPVFNETYIMFDWQEWSIREKINDAGEQGALLKWCPWLGNGKHIGIMGSIDSSDYMGTEHVPVLSCFLLFAQWNREPGHQLRLRGKEVLEI